LLGIAQRAVVARRALAEFAVLAATGVFVEASRGVFLGLRVGADLAGEIGERVATKQIAVADVLSERDGRRLGKTQPVW
jgi:hypothetical protein